MSNNIHSLISREEMDFLLSGEFKPKGKKVVATSLLTKSTSRTRPSRSSRSSRPSPNVLSSLEVQFLLSDFDVFVKKAYKDISRHS